MEGKTKATTTKNAFQQDIRENFSEIMMQDNLLEGVIILIYR